MLSKIGLWLEIKERGESLCIKTIILLLGMIVLSYSQCCLTFSANNKCIQCQQGMHLYRDNCLFDIDNCVSYENGFQCIKCKYGYELLSDINICQPVTPIFPHTTNPITNSSLVYNTTTPAITLIDINLSGFMQLTRQQILSTDRIFNIEVFPQLIKIDKYKGLSKNDIVYVFSKNQSISGNYNNSSYEYLRQYGIYRVVILTQAGFDQVLVAIDFSDSSLQVIESKVFSNISLGYKYFNVESDEIWPFIQPNVKNSQHFVVQLSDNNNEDDYNNSTYNNANDDIITIGNITNPSFTTNIFNECSMFDSYMKTSSGNLTVLNEFLMYFIHINYGVIQVHLALEVYKSISNQSTTEQVTILNNNITNNNNSSNNNSSTATVPGGAINLPTASNTTTISGSTNTSTQIDQNSLNTQTQLNSVIQLLNIFNLSYPENFTQLSDTQFNNSPLYPNLTLYLSQQRPTLYNLSQSNIITSNFGIIDSAVSSFPLKDIILLIAKQTNNQSIIAQLNQLTISQVLDIFTCVIYRLTFQIQYLQPYQVKVLIITKQKYYNTLSNSNSGSLYNYVDNTCIYQIKIITELGDPQIDYYSTTNNLQGNYATYTTLTPTNQSQLIKMIPYPQSDDSLINNVKFFLEMQYGDIIEQSQLTNYTYQQKPLNSSQILNLSNINDTRLRTIQAKNNFGSTYRVYTLTFTSSKGSELTFIVQYKQNQIDLLQVPTISTELEVSTNSSILSNMTVGNQTIVESISNISSLNNSNISSIINVSSSINNVSSSINNNTDITISTIQSNTTINHQEIVSNTTTNQLQFNTQQLPVTTDNEEQITNITSNQIDQQLVQQHKVQFVQSSLNQQIQQQSINSQPTSQQIISQQSTQQQIQQTSPPQIAMSMPISINLNELPTPRLRTQENYQKLDLQQINSINFNN